MKTTYSASWQEDGRAAVPGRLEVTPEVVAFTPAGGEEPQEIRLADEANVARVETLHGLRAEHGSFEEELRELRVAVQVLPELTDVRCHEFGLVATDLMRRIVRHARVEELEVYPVVERLPGGGLLVEAMLFDHRAIEEAACELARVDRDDHACLMREFHRLDALVTTHMAKEETIVFPLLDA